MRVLDGMRKVMAVASGGGHWVELRRLMPAFAGREVLYVSTEPVADADLAPARYYRGHQRHPEEPSRLREHHPRDLSPSSAASARRWS